MSRDSFKRNSIREALKGKSVGGILGQPWTRLDEWVDGQLDLAEVFEADDESFGATQQLLEAVVKNLDAHLDGSKDPGLLLAVVYLNKVRDAVDRLAEQVEKRSTHVGKGVDT